MKSALPIVKTLLAISALQPGSTEPTTNLTPNETTQSLGENGTNRLLITIKSLHMKSNGFVNLGKYRPNFYVAIFRSTWPDYTYYGETLPRYHEVSPTFNHTFLLNATQSSETLRLYVVQLETDNMHSDSKIFGIRVLELSLTGCDRRSSTACLPVSSTKSSQTVRVERNNDHFADLEIEAVIWE